MICFICNKEMKNHRSLGIHIKKSHNISSEEYYLKYIGKIGKCEICNSNTKFLSIKEGYRKFCSSKCYGKSEKSNNKRKNTCIEKYGVDNPLQSEEIQKKRLKTLQNNYNTDNPMKNSYIKNKYKETMNNKHGVECPAKSNIILEKMKKTNKEKYGSEFPLQSEEIREIVEQSNLEKYGVKHTCCDPEVINKMKESKLKNFFVKILNSDRLKDKCIPKFNLEDYEGIHKKYRWLCKNCEQIFEDDIEDGKIPRCLDCYPILNNSSGFEKEILYFCKKYFNNVIENDRNILEGKELDIYIPEINLAIECNGLYWHSELSGKDKKYHLEKTMDCNKKDIQLIHIFEDEWYDKQDIVKSILLAKFGKIEKRIYARKCKLYEISPEESDIFLFENHLQGTIRGNKYIGLIYNGELVSLLVIGNSRFDTHYDNEILRFCNKKNIIVIGALSKLVSKIKGKLISYCDLRYSNGKGYESAGFILIKQSPPNYFYLDKNKRCSRHKFKKHLLKGKLEFFYNNLTEWQNMQMNKWNRIWDCGNLVFERN